METTEPQQPVTPPDYLAPQPESPTPPQPPRWMLRRKVRNEKRLAPQKDLVGRAVEHRERLIDLREMVDDETRLFLRIGLPTLAELALRTVESLP